jgi:hypothetical protein
MSKDVDGFMTEWDESAPTTRGLHTTRRKKRRMPIIKPPPESADEFEETYRRPSSAATCTQRYRARYVTEPSPPREDDSAEIQADTTL